MDGKENDPTSALCKLFNYARGLLPESALAKKEKSFLYGMVENMALAELDGIELMRIEQYSIAFDFVRYIEQVLGLDSPLENLAGIRRKEEQKIKKSREKFARDLEQSLGLGKEKVEPWLEGMRDGAFHLATIYFREQNLSNNELSSYVFPAGEEFVSVARRVMVLRPAMDDFQKRGVEEIFNLALKMLEKK